MSNASPAESAPLKGLYAATFTPFDEMGEMDLSRVPDLVEHLASNGVSGIYVCGTTGEAASLSSEERRAATEAYVAAARQRGIKVIVQVGHTAIKECQALAAHAEGLGVDAVSSVAPYYFKANDTATLVATLAEIAAAAPSVPFYYYHIPSLTGATVDPVVLLEQGGDLIPTLRGLKYTDADLAGLSACRQVDSGRFDVLFGRDEMLLAALAMGCRGAVGSTYNIAPVLYVRILEAFDAGRLDEALALQETAVRMVRRLVGIAGGEGGIKAAMAAHGLDCGQRRLPNRPLTDRELNALAGSLDEMGFIEWATRPRDAT